MSLLDDDGAGAGPVVALRVRDPRLRERLEQAFRVGPAADAEVLVLDLFAGETLPPDAAAFDGAVLVLGEDSALIGDASLAGVLPPASSERQIAAAVAALAEGLAVRLPLQREPAEFGPRDGSARPLLTPREVEVLALVGQGQSNKAIARRLNISAHTVKYHLEAIFAKLGVRSRAEAVTRGLRLGVQVL